MVRIKSEYECCIYLENGRVRDPDDERWTTTDKTSAFTIYPEEANFAVAIFHPDGFACADWQDIAEGKPLALKPWAKVDLTVDGSAGISTEWKGETKDAIQLNFQVFSGSQKGILFPAGRAWVQRTVQSKNGMNIGLAYKPFNLVAGQSEPIVVAPPTPEDLEAAERIANKN